MNLTINIVCGIVLTTITGSILSLFWYFAGLLMERLGFADIRHIFLKVVLVFYLVPLTYIITKIYIFVCPLPDMRFFYRTPSIGMAADILASLWFAFVLLLTYRSICGYIRIKKLAKQSFPCDNEVLDYFNKIAKQLGIKTNKLKLGQNYGTVTPLITGFFNATVIIPVRDYTEEELQIIFLHELLHYKHKDIILKRFMVVVNIIHFFNPLVWWLNNKLQKWCEFTCDWEAYPIVGAKKYFEIILSLANDEKNTNFATHLVEKKSELEERIEHMKKYRKAKRFPKYVAALMSACIVFLSTTTVFAATDMVNAAYFNLFDMTVVQEKLENEEEKELTLYHEAAGESKVPVVIGEVNQLTRSTTAFLWTVSGNQMVETDKFYASSGTTIRVSVFLDPANLYIDYGIVNTDGSLTYVTGGDDSSYSFSAPTSGYYRVFVRNNNSSSVKVDGSYMLR